MTLVKSNPTKPTFGLGLTLFRLGLTLVNQNLTKLALGLVWVLLSLVWLSIWGLVWPWSNQTQLSPYWARFDFFWTWFYPSQTEPNRAILSSVWPWSNLVQHGVCFDPDQIELDWAYIRLSLTLFRLGSIEQLSLLLLFPPSLFPISL